MLRNQDEDELKELLSETYANHSYMDKQIEDLFGSKQETLPLRHIESSDSLQSSGLSQSHFKKEDQSLSLHSQKQQRQRFSIQRGENSPGDPALGKHIFDDIYEKINQNLKAQTVEGIRSKYPLFLLSQPSYDIKDHIKSVSLSYSGNLLRKNILVMDVGYCEQQKVFKVAVGTDEGNVVIFQPNSSKPQHVIQCFSKVCTITCVKWSKNLQFLAIANDEKQLNVYCFKQPITIENNITYRILKSPSEFCTINQKYLNNIITELAFVNENPFKMVIVDQNDQIFKLQLKKHFINTRPHLTQFNIKFTKFLDLNFHHMSDNFGNKGTLMAVSGQSFITFCQIEPGFQVAMVFDKQKHGSSIKKSGFPHVNFRSQPNSVLVIWDKYLQIMNIEIEQFTPFKHRFSITHKFVLPDSTIIGGFLSNTFIYQINRIGVKIYSTTSIEKDISNQFRSRQVYFQKINFSNFCYGEKIEQFISNPDIQTSNLRFLKGLFKSVNRNLFYCTNKNVQMIYFSTLQQYISNLIQNNNWKIALEILKDCYLGKVHQLDEIHTEMMQSKIMEISSRYINFLQTIIISEDEKHENINHIELLWNQQLIFIFNVLITTNLETYLLEEVLKKIHKLNPVYIKNIIPFILMNKITKVSHVSLELLMHNIPLDIISRLLFKLQVINNDSQLPHQINNLLIKNDLLLQFIDLNHKFKDYYTPLAVLAGIYLKLEHDLSSNIFQSAEKKRKIGRLLAYCVFQTLNAINFNKHGKHYNKEMLDSILRLLTDQIFSILIREEPTALFQNILDQLYMGGCLQALNQLDVLECDGDLMKKVIQSISYEQVQYNKCEKKYWIAILKLYSRRIIVDLKIFVGLKYLTIEDNIEKEFMSKFVQKCYEQILLELQTISVEVLEEFFEALLYTEHIYLVVMIGKFLNRYVTTLDAMLADQSQRNEKVYDFIDEFIKKIPPKQLKLLCQLLKKHIKFFTSANAKKASDIICRYYLSDLNIFIDDLSDYPLEQLKLIRSVLELYSYDESLTDLKVRYLELLASNRMHDLILIQLMKQKYPLEQSLSICQKYQALQAWGYLLVKSGGEGNTEAAINVYFRLIDQQIQRIVTRSHGDVQFFQFEDIIMKYVKKCINICQELDVKFKHHYQNEWFIVLEQLQLLKRSLFRNWILGNQNVQILRDIINKKAYPELIQSLISELDHTHITDYLRNNMTKFDLEALQIIIEEMVKSYVYERRIFLIQELLLIQYQNSCRSTVFKSEVNIYSTQLRGFLTPSICSVCNQKGDLLVHYGCGHENHPSCSNDVKECILCSKNIQIMYRKKIDNITGLRIDIYSNGVKQDLDNVERQINRQERLRRLQMYDQYSFFDV